MCLNSSSSLSRRKDRFYRARPAIFLFRRKLRCFLGRNKQERKRARRDKGLMAERAERVAMECNGMGSQFFRNLLFVLCCRALFRLINLMPFSAENSKCSCTLYSLPFYLYACNTLSKIVHFVYKCMQCSKTSVFITLNSLPYYLTMT